MSSESEVQHNCEQIVVDAGDVDPALLDTSGSYSSGDTDGDAAGDVPGDVAGDVVGSGFASSSSASSSSAAPTEAPTVSTDEPDATDAPANAQPTDNSTEAAPILFPTLEPTEAATNPPKPPYVAADFDYITDAEAVDSITASTLAPTAAPTEWPTLEHFVMVEIETAVAVISTALSFPLTVVEASNDVMKRSIEAGFAASLGLGPEACTITMIAGVVVDRVRRSRHLHESSIIRSGDRSGAGLDSKRTLGRRLDDLQIVFDVQSASRDAAEMEALKDSITTAAQDGAIVANVQAKAVTNGVLVESLKWMTRELAAPTMIATEKNVTVLQPVRITSTTSTPTASPTKSHVALPSRSPIPTPSTEMVPTDSPTDSPTGPSLVKMCGGVGFADGVVGASRTSSTTEVPRGAGAGGACGGGSSSIASTGAAGVGGAGARVLYTALAPETKDWYSSECTRLGLPPLQLEETMGYMDRWERRKSTFK
jgi:hypothetical protein